MKDNTVTKAEVIIANTFIDNFTGKYCVKVYDISGEEIAIDAQLLKSAEQDREMSDKWKEEAKEKLEKENKNLREQLEKSRQDFYNMKREGVSLMARLSRLGVAIKAYPKDRKRSTEYRILKDNWEYITSPNNFTQFK